MCAKLEIEKKRLLSNFIFHYWSKPLQKRHIIRHNFDDVIIFVYVFSGVDSAQLVLLVDRVTCFNIVNSETVSTKKNYCGTFSFETLFCGTKNFFAGRCISGQFIFLWDVRLRVNLFFCGKFPFGTIYFFAGRFISGSCFVRCTRIDVMKRT